MSRAPRDGVLMWNFEGLREVHPVPEILKAATSGGGRLWRIESGPATGWHVLGAIVGEVERFYVASPGGLVAIDDAGRVAKYASFDEAWYACAYFAARAKRPE